MQLFNASAVANVHRVAYNPALCLPHLRVDSFDKLVFPLAIPGASIRAIVLDKDNCFAKDHDDKIWPAYQQAWERLRAAYFAEHILIVSNSAGTNDDAGHKQAEKLEQETGVCVLRHATKKPGCHAEITAHFAERGITRADEIAVIGDRLLTDVFMANMMGAWSVWLSEGVQRSTALLPWMERTVYKMVSRTDPFVPPMPDCDTEEDI